MNKKDVYVLTRMVLVFCSAIFILYPICELWLDNYQDELWHTFASYGIGLFVGVISIVVGFMAAKKYDKYIKER